MGDQSYQPALMESIANMVIMTSDLVGKWQTAIGSDGYVHVMPVGEEHDPHFGCICNPIQKQYAAVGSMFTHRVLTC